MAERYDQQSHYERTGPYLASVRTHRMYLVKSERHEPFWLPVISGLVIVAFMVVVFFGEPTPDTYSSAPAGREASQDQ